MNNPEWLLIDKVGDYLYFDKIENIADYLCLTKSQIYSCIIQSLKHYNKYTNRGIYIQKLYNNPGRPPKNNYDLDKYVYYINDDDSLRFGELFKK